MPDTDKYLLNVIATEAGETGLTTLELAHRAMRNPADIKRMLKAARARGLLTGDGRGWFPTRSLMAMVRYGDDAALVVHDGGRDA